MAAASEISSSRPISPLMLAGCGGLVRQGVPVSYAEGWFRNYLDLLFPGRDTGLLREKARGSNHLGKNARSGKRQEQLSKGSEVYWSKVQLGLRVPPDPGVQDGTPEVGRSDPEGSGIQGLLGARTTL